MPVGGCMQLEHVVVPLMLRILRTCSMSLCHCQCRGAWLGGRGTAVQMLSMPSS